MFCIITERKAPDRLFISNILQVNHWERSKRMGSYILEGMCKWADFSNTILICEPKPFSPENEEMVDFDSKKIRLVEWYKRNGFVEKENGQFEREPNKITK